MTIKRAHLIITGHVQGVFFRAETKKTAEKLNITGWVKNLPDGSVESYACGISDSLEKFIKWCHQGPAVASVKNVAVEWNKDLGSFETFEVTE